MTERPLHVAYVVEAPYPSFAVREILSLRRAGVRVTVLNSFRPFDQDGAEAEALRRESLYLRGGVRGALLDMLRILLLHPVRLGRAAGAVLRRRLSPRLLALAARYALAIRSQGIVHVHGMYATTPASVALLTSRLAGVPCSFTAHAYDIYLSNPLFAWKLRHARFMTTISRFNRELILRRWPGSDPGKVHVVYLGVEAGSTPPPRRAPAQVARILSVAALYPRKGHGVLLDACAELRRSGRGIGVTLVGDGPLRSSLEERARRLGIGDLVTFAGARPHEEVSRHLYESDLFVLPCVIEGEDQDGIPVALMEAMAAGIPVVSTRVSGIPELVEHGVSGILVPPEDPVCLAEAMGRILDDPDLARSLSRGGRARIEEAFDLDRNAREMRALFAGPAGAGG